MAQSSQIRVVLGSVKRRRPYCSTKTHNVGPIVVPNPYCCSVVTVQHFNSVQALTLHSSSPMSLFCGQRPCFVDTFSRAGRRLSRRPHRPRTMAPRSPWHPTGWSQTWSHASDHRELAGHHHHHHHHRHCDNGGLHFSENLVGRRGRSRERPEISPWREPPPRASLEWWPAPVPRPRATRALRAAPRPAAAAAAACGRRRCQVAVRRRTVVAWQPFVAD